MKKKNSSLFNDKQLKFEHMWAIVGKYGLYTGTRLRKMDIIKDFVLSKCHGIKTEEEIKKAWRRCKYKGNRAVKVIIGWKE